MRRLDDAEAILLESHSICGSSHDFAQYHALLATVLDRQGKHEDSDEEFLNARAFAFGIPSVALQAELAFYEAQAAWRRQDYEQVEHIALASLREIPKPWDEPHPCPVEVSHAYLYELLASVQGVREQHQSQTTFLKLGLDTLSHAKERHVWTEAGLLYNFASVVPEVRVSDILERIRFHAETLDWTTETAGWAYNVYRALGWSEALKGNYVAAFRDLREAHALAPTSPWRIESILDRAYLFEQIGETFSAQERFDEAIRLCKQVDWSDTGEERYALLWVAEIASQIDAACATGILARYKSVRKPIDSALIASTHSRRLLGHEHDAYGAVAAANGAIAIALSHFNTSLQIWDDLKFEWRAAKTAGAIARLTGRTEDIAAARRRAEPFANSWLARRP